MEDFEEYVKGFDEENKPFDVIELKRQFEELKQKTQCYTYAIFVSLPAIILNLFTEETLLLSFE